MQSIQQPGENNENGSVTGQNKKKELQDLNSRLQDYLNRTKNTNREIGHLKSVISQTEIEWRKKLKDAEQINELSKQKLREENEHLQFQAQHHLEQLTQTKADNEDYKKRLELSESAVSKYLAETEILRKQTTLLKQEAENIRAQHAKLDFQYKNYAEEKESLMKQVTSLNERKSELLKEKTKQASENRAQIDYYSRMLSQKTADLDKLEAQVKELTATNEACQSRLRAEFDDKLKDFVAKREVQYEQEKQEWMRIFKEEFNQKLRSFKEANKDLSHANKKKEEEIESLRERLSAIQKSKTELEVTNRNLEEELEKLRNDLDALRLSKDEEIRVKELKLVEIREKLKKKEQEYSDLYTLKQQLTEEIELYQKILSEAEKEAGYASPFAGGNSTRKKRKLTSGENACYPTPGIARAAKSARADITRIQGGSENMNETDFEDADNKEADSSEVEQDDHVTPGEAFPLQFSTMDLGKSMLELQNISENSVSLRGFMITNKDGSAKFPLPDERVLQPNEKVRVIIGLRVKSKQSEILWKADVWSGDEEDVARLYDPENKEIARIEIHPDMLPPQDKSCLIM